MNGKEQTVEQVNAAGFRLSPQQDHVWTLLEANGGRRYRGACAIEFTGPVTYEAVRRALQASVERHEILRTSFARQQGMKAPFQVIADSYQPQWQQQDLTGLSAAEQQERITQLLEAEHEEEAKEEAQLLRAQWLRLGEGRNVVVLGLPALAADRASLLILAKELAGLEGEGEILQYADVTEWQHALLDSTETPAVSAKAFWTAQKPGSVALLGERQRKSADSYEANYVAVKVAEGLASGVECVAQEAGATVPDVLLAVWQTLLWRLSGEERPVVQVCLDGREYDEMKGSIGLFARHLPVSAKFDGKFRFSEMVKRMQLARKEAAEYQEYCKPGTAGESGNAVGFEFADCATPRGVRVLCQRVFTEAHKVKLICLRDAAGLSLQLEYDGSRYGRSEMEQVGRHLGVLLQGAIKEPESLVSRLPLLDRTERERMEVEWNRTEREYPRASMQELIEAQVKLTPERAAVRCGEEVLTYAELNRRANQLGSYLRQLGVGPNGLVGLCLERSVEMLVAVLGIWKAGGGYVPLNADNPQARLAQQLEGVKVLLTESGLAGQMPSFAGATLLLDKDSAKWSGEPEENLAASGTVDDLAYVIYTSGSTGVPKGVGVRQRNLVNYASYIAQDLLKLEEYPEGLQFATVSTLGADLGNTCIYPALLSGGCVHVVPYEVATDGREMGRYSERYQVDVLKIVPSHLRALLEASGNDAIKVLPRKYLIMGGEALTRSLLEQIEAAGAKCAVINHYGPTETTVGSLVQRLSEYDWKGSSANSIPIGKPIGNTQAYVLDGEMQVVPEGVSGELYISGAGVAAGYVGQAEKTGERFIPNPFDPTLRAQDARRMGHPTLYPTLYRTGDVVRYEVGGEGRIEFLGRADDQVKVRGFRVELGEIEAGLLKQTGVKQAVVVAQAAADQESRLVGYVVLERRSGVTVEQLKHALEKELPGYMVPSVLVVLDKLPLNANGKVDRKGLPQAEEAIAQAKQYIAPEGATEELVAQIWGEVLKLKQVGREDDFFQLGGHSLLATQVVSRIREQSNVEIALRTLFEASKLSEFAAKIDTVKQSGKTAGGPIKRVAREAYRSVKTGA